MISLSMSPSQSAPDPGLSAPLRRVRRSVLERHIGYLSHSSAICGGHTSTLLQRLASGGGLYLTNGGALAEIHPTVEPDTLDVRIYSGPPESLWEGVRSQLPEVIPGETTSRFWVVHEYGGEAGALIYGVLDVVAMDVLERSTDAEEVLGRVTTANADPGSYLREIAWGRAFHIISEVVDSARVRV
jgi:hypothetical protein